MTQQVFRSESAFSNFVKMVQPRVQAHLRRRYVDEQLADEAAGEAMSRLFEKWSSDPDFFRSPAHMLNWVRRVGCCQAINQLRWRNRHHPLHDATLELYCDQQDSDRRTWDLEQVRKCLGKLSDSDRQLLEDHFDRGMTDSEVGNERFGSEGTRGSRLLKVFRLRQKALKRLGLLLVQGGVDPNDWNMQRVRPARRCPKEGVNEPACSRSG